MSHESRFSFRGVVRRLSQFSIRTLLVLITLAALTLWFYRSPSAEETRLAGGAILSLHQRADPDYLANPENYAGEQLILHGKAKVRDAHGRTIVTGQYSDHSPVGTWRAYHENGRLRAYTNRAHTNGVGTGNGVGTPHTGYYGFNFAPDVEFQNWQTWHSNGNRQTLHNDLPSPQSSSKTGAPPTRRVQVQTWYDNGQMRSQGPLSDGRRVGKWTFWNRDGQPLAEGEYLNHLRHGLWQFTADDGTSRQVHYLLGNPTAPPQELLSQLRAALATSDRQQQAIADLLHLGAEGDRCLAEAIQAGSPPERREFLKTIIANEAYPTAVADAITSLPDAEKERLHTLIQLANYFRGPEHRVAAVCDLLESAAELPIPDRRQLLQQCRQLGTTLPTTVELVLQDRSLAKLHRPAIQLLYVQIKQRGRYPESWDPTSLLARIQEHHDPAIAEAASELLIVWQVDYARGYMGGPVGMPAGGGYF